MNDEQIKAMKADMAAGTQGPWVYEYTGIGHTVRQPGAMNCISVNNRAAAPEIDARRIARVPAMEAEILRLRAALTDCSDFLDEIVRCSPDVFSGRALDPQDDVDDMIALNVLETFRAVACALLAKIGGTP